MKRTYLFLSALALLFLGATATVGEESGDKQLKNAIDAYVESDYSRAHKLLEPLAQAGRSEAQLMLGILYERGYSVKQDVVTAYAWYLRASRLRNQKAQQELGRLTPELAKSHIAAAEQLADDQRIVLDGDFACISFFGESFNSHYVTAFKAHDAIDAIVTDILGQTGLTKNFFVQAANVPNASAVVQNGTRYVLYNPYFINEVNDRSGTAWAAISIMAHEVGHHLEGHTIRPGGSRPSIELEADRFSGFVLAKLGAGLQDAQAAMANLASPGGSSTHPPRADRLAAIENGWTDAMKKTTPSAAAAASRPVSPRVSPVPPPVSSPSFRVARVCATEWGSCPMMIPVRVGSVCYCPTPYGSVPGYGR